MKDEDKLEVSADVYQMQLTQLQEQLVTAMIDNETLKTELTDLKVKHKVDSLIQELDFERKRTKQLFVELQQARKSIPLRTVEREDFVDLAQEVTDEIDLTKDVLPPKKVSRFEAVRNYLISAFYELMADFTEDVDEGDAAEDDQDLTIKQLKENILRTKSGLSPVIHLFKACFHTLAWKAPLSTLMIFMVYLYSAWYGWLVSLVLILAVAALTFSFLQSRGWKINFGFFAEEDDDGAEKNVDIADRFNLVLQVAKRVQNVLGVVADGLEKIKNLLMWQHPSATGRLYVVLIVAFILSCVLTGPNFCRLIALCAGLKLFIIDFIFDRFPRFKHHHDSNYRIWMELPTDADLEKRQRKCFIEQQIIGKSRNSVLDIDVFESFSPDSDVFEIQSFCALFSLPLCERPLPGWEDGWRATLVDTSRSFLKSLTRSGKLFLTNSFLCLERHKNPSPKNIIIPLKDITHMEKAKPYGWVPGSGMSIEVSVVGFEQPYTFGTIINRDECFIRLVSHGTMLGLPWAMEHASILPLKPAVDESDGTEAKPSPDKLSVEKTFRMSDLKDDLDYEDLTTLGT